MVRVKIEPNALYRGSDMKILLVPAVALALSACSTVTDGTSQGITLSSNAPALCSISQNGVEIVPATAVPATHKIGRASGNLIVSCSAEGYEPETVALVTGKHPMAVTGILLTGMLINTGTDAATSAWHESQNQAYIHLRKKSAL